MKQALSQSERIVDNLNDELNLKQTHLNEIDSTVTSIENLEEDINQLSDENDEEERQELINTIQKQENYIILLEKKIQSQDYDIENDETEELVKTELASTQKRLNKFKNQLSQLADKPQKYLEEKERLINSYRNSQISLKEKLVTIILSNDENTKEKTALLEKPTEEIGALAKQKLEEKFAILETRISKEQQTIKNLKDQLAPTNPKLRKRYLQSKDIDSQFDTLVVEHQGEFKLLTVYLGEKKGKSLGAGAFGKVKIAQDEEGNFWAIKYLAKNQHPGLQKKEYHMLEKLHEAGGQLQFTSEKNLRKYGAGVNVMIMKLASGIPLSKPPQATTSDLGTVEKLGAISDAILNLHKKNIIHFDLKPENILYDAANKRATIIDYGTAAIIPAGKKGLRPSSGSEADSEDIISLRGSPLYAPLEMRKDLYAAMYHHESDYVKAADFIHTPAFDVYTAGILMADHLGLTESKYQREAEKIEEYLQIVDVNSEQFTNNQAIKNPTLRKEVLTMLKKMTSDNPEERPSMDVVKQFFSNKRKAFTVKESLINTAVVNLDDYKKLSPLDKSTTREALKQYEEVILISPHEAITIDLNDSIYIKKEFEDQGILVREELFYGSNSVPDIVSALPARDSQQSGHPLNSYSFVSVTNHQVKETPINLNSLTQEVIYHLKNYRNQMGVSLDHKKSLNQAIGKLEKEKLNLSQIRETLDDLQKKTGSKLSTNFKSQFFMPEPSERHNQTRSSFKPKP
nr:protein kinase [Legionella sp. PL877]